MLRREQPVVFLVRPIHQPKRNFGCITRRDLVRCIEDPDAAVVFGDRVSGYPCLALSRVADYDVRHVATEIRPTRALKGGQQRNDRSD